jgi:TPR repeat protein/class 3 adenylate cyclase
MDREDEHKHPSRDRDASTPEVAHVLLMDVVSFGLLSMDQQHEAILQLQDIVRLLPEFDRAKRADEVVSLPAGDGMALAFFRDLTAPASCARMIALTVKNNPLFKLRMGIHSGPVFRHADINANLNMIGGGINDAQRVMNCGDGGHILVSKTTADMLVQFNKWKDAFHDLGEIEVKHDKRIHVFNMFTEEFGNPRVPSKVLRRMEPETPTPVADSAPASTFPQPAQSRWPRWLVALIASLVLASTGAFFAYQKFGPSGNKSSVQPATAPPLKQIPPAEGAAPSNPNTMALPEPPPLAFSSAAEKNWKDRAEYDLYSAIVKDTNPKTRLESLDRWQQLYPASDFLKERRALLLNTYAALGQAKEAVTVAQQILADDPKNFVASYYTLFFVRQMANSPQFADLLDRSENAAAVILSSIDLPPKNISQEQWKTTRPAVEKAVHATLGWIGIQRKNWAMAQSELQMTLALDPNNAEADYWLGSAIVAEKTPEKQFQALYYFARAATYDGPGALPADVRGRLLAYVREQYKTYRGSESGLDDLLKLAAREASPPSDFKIERASAEENAKGAAVEDGSDAASQSDHLASLTSAKAEVSRTAPPGEPASPLARGLAFYNARNYGSALPLLRQAADSGDSQAMTIVGWMYQRGWAVSQDYVEAMKWFRKGAVANPANPASAAEIGQLYLTGAGVQQDYAEAMRWFRRAADAGSAFGMWKVGILYQNGWGAHKDYNEASNWFTKAADAGEVRAMGSIGLLYQDGRGVHRDFGQALLWFQKGAAAGNRDDMRRVGFLYEHGWGIRKNYDEAMKWYRQASVVGDYIAMSLIGNLYEHGSGVKKDKGEAISWYRKAVAAGNTQANIDLRRLHAQP